MTRRNRLLESPPYPVEQTLQQLGANLRLARTRRSMTVADAADRIGTGPRAVMDAERGKPATGMIVYAALLWLYDQLDQLSEVADPSNDIEGQALEFGRRRKRVRKRKGLDNDF
jgi:DNA-binding XRE family transcriptional regulator